MGLEGHFALSGKLWKLPLCGKVGENQTTVFPHLSTELGKLSAQNAPSFPQFPQLRLLVIDLFAKLLKERFACFIFLLASMQFLKNLNHAVSILLQHTLKKAVDRLGSATYNF